MGFEERFVLNKKSKENIIYNEHLVRYKLASDFVFEKKLLDIACGSGFGAKILSQAGAKEVVAVDIDEQALAKAGVENEAPNISYKKDNAENLAEKDEDFDVIVSFETIEHLKNPEKYLSELKRVIKKEGIVFISTPNKKVWQEKNPFHFREFEKKEFEDLLGKYFKSIVILEQVNGIASVIKGAGKSGTIETGEGEALYFIAVCSNGQLPIIDKNIASVNPSALKNLYNNPALKFSDKIYGLFNSFFKK